MTGGVKVRQIAGQIYDEGTAAAYVERSIVREVPDSSEIRAATDGETAAASNCIQLRQRIRIIRRVENLHRSTRQRDIRGICHNPVGACGELNRPVVGNVAAASQCARCAAKVGERSAGGNDIEYRPADYLHSAVVREILRIGLDVE